MANSPLYQIEQNAIFRVSHRKTPGKPPDPSEIKTFNYTAQLTDARWLRRRARRLYG